MAEPQKQQMGDGSDNIGQAAGQAAKAAKNAGKQAAKQAAKKGAEAAANAAAATVKAGVEGGKAVAEIAAGTAAGGPWGAIISAAWAMRHTLFKILVCLCLSVVFLIVMIVELPGIIINKALGLDGNEPTVSITEIYENLSETVSDIVQAGYDASMAEVERLISDGGYDRELSMNALINYAQSSAGYDTAYILSAYSTSVEQLSNDPEDMQKKLDGVTANMFPVTSVERENEAITPVTYYGETGEYWYDLGSDGISVGKITGLFAYENDLYYAVNGKTKDGWREIETSDGSSQYYYFDPTT